VRARYPDAIVAALIDKTGGVSGVIAGKQTPAGEWVEFPWEAIGAL
jgi:xanthine phosphoribosyltransferase